ncbi:MAG: HipA family kinase [Syntrophorhabdales bacterium]|jgi:hypothetical protein
MIARVKASAFAKALRSGRTCPFLMVCYTQEGSQHEVVVKLFSGSECTKAGLVCELVASLLAQDLRLPVPQPFLVEIDADFHHAVDLTFATRFEKSTGLNFGSKFLGPGYVTWPQQRSIPVPLLQTAAEIFAFDVMIQNPDRREDKPNVLRKSDELAILDDELAFSFLYALIPEQYPWDGKGLDFAYDHVFYKGLRGHQVSWERMQAAFDAIDNLRIEIYMEALPKDWRDEGTNNAIMNIQDYFIKAKESSKKLFQIIREVLV